MFLRIKMEKMDKKKLSFIKSANMNALLFLISINIRFEKRTRDYLFI